VWQCVAVYGSLLQCVAVCCSVCIYSVPTASVRTCVCESMSMYVFAVYLESVGRYTTRLYTWCVTGRCSVLQCVAACCSVLQGVAVCGSVWHFVAVCCSVLQCVPVCVSTVFQQHRDARVCESMSMYVFTVYLESVGRYTTRLYTSCVAGCCSVLQCVTVRCMGWHGVAVYGCVLQCVTVWCSVLQCILRAYIDTPCNSTRSALLCCSVLQCVAVCCSVLQCVAADNAYLQYTSSVGRYTIRRYTRHTGSKVSKVVLVA